MLHQNNKSQINSISLKKTLSNNTIKDYCPKKANPSLKEHLNQITQPTITVNSKTKLTVSHTKSVSHLLTNSMSFIPSTKQIYNNNTINCTSHSLSKEKNIDKAKYKTIASKKDHNRNNITQDNSIEKQECFNKENVIGNFKSISNKEKGIGKKCISTHVTDNASKEIVIEDLSIVNETIDHNKEKRRFYNNNNGKENSNHHHYQHKHKQNKHKHKHNLLSQHIEQQPLKLYIEGYKNQLKTNLSIQVNKDYNYFAMKANCNSNTKYAIHSSSSQSPVQRDQHKVNYNNTKSDTKTNKSNDIASMPTLFALQKIENKYLQKLNDNHITNSKSKTYNTIKIFFEELIQLFPNDYQKTFRNILCKYHEVVLGFSIENKTLKEANSIYQKRLGNIEKNHKDVIDLLKRKENELGYMRQRLAEVISFNNSHLHFNMMSNEIKTKGNNCNSSSSSININVNNKDENNLTAVNPQNIEDLDSLYFFDKVANKGRKEITHTIIPALPINIEINKIKKHCLMYGNENKSEGNEEDTGKEELWKISQTWK